MPPRPVAYVLIGRHDGAGNAKEDCSNAGARLEIGRYCFAATWARRCDTVCARAVSIMWGEKIVCITSV